MELIYFSILIGAFMLLLSTVIFGEIFDLGESIFGEVGEIAEGIGEVDADFDAGLDLGSDLDFHTPSFLSSRTMFAGLVLFGAAGFIAENQGASTLLSVLIALAGMASGSLLMYFGLVVPASKQQASDIVRPQDWVGLTAQVASAIPAAGLGTVSFIAQGDGALHREAAQSENGEAIARGTSVIIMQVGAGSVIVKPSRNTK